MPFCPDCSAEYREGFTVCSDCKSFLVDSLPQEEKPKSNFKRIKLSSFCSILFLAIAMVLMFNPQIVDFIPYNPENVLYWPHRTVYFNFLNKNIFPFISAMFSTAALIMLIIKTVIQSKLKDANKLSVAICVCLSVCVISFPLSWLFFYRYDIIFSLLESIVFILHIIILAIQIFFIIQKNMDGFFQRKKKLLLIVFLISFLFAYEGIAYRDYLVLNNSEYFTDGYVGYIAWTPPTVYAYKRLRINPFAGIIFKQLERTGTSSAKAYAIVALKDLDPLYAIKLKEKYRIHREEIEARGGCIVYYFDLYELFEYDDGFSIEDGGFSFFG